MTDDKDKRVFKDKLSGKTIARDIFDTPMFEGEFLLHAAGGTSPEMRVLKILEVRNKMKWKYGAHGKTEHVEVSLKVRRATRGWGSHRNKWTLQDRHSFIKTLDHCIVLTDPKPELVELFKDV
jgi:hypothetical protein